MNKLQPTPLPVALRVYPKPEGINERPGSSRRYKRPNAMLVFDTETRIDATQRLTFGSYRFIQAGGCLEEGILYADDLLEKELQVLRQFAATHGPETVAHGNRKLQLLTRREFVERFYDYGFDGRCLVVAFNFSFDVSRVAFNFTEARRDFAGGFSLELWPYNNDSGCEQQNPYRPRIAIKHIDSKRAMKGFTGCYKPDEIDLIPEGSITGKPEVGHKFRGHFVDLRTLAFALTDRGFTLETACNEFGVEHGKQHVEQHGEITETYIDYNRRDVLATWELAVKLLEEYDKHPISLQATRAYSPASIGKAYLRTMGIEPILKRQPDFPKEYLGYAESAFFGGRTSAHIRKVAVPVVYTDFLSMYPTVNSLMGLWRFVIAREIRVGKHCHQEISAFLNRLKAKPDELFDPKTWRRMAAFVRIIPDGDILPSRARYSTESNDWQVAVNHLYGDLSRPDDALWFSLADVITSVLLTGRIPHIVDAFRIEPCGTLPGLEPTRLRSTIGVDPSSQDFFRVVIEQRKQLPLRNDIPEVEKKRLNKALKVLANAASYGIYAEMNRQESDQEVNVKCHGIDLAPFTCRVAQPDVPGEYCFPPMASLITGAARLMLALLEHSIHELGGTYAMEDTDSMAIVATERGGMIPCPGGPRRLPDGRAAIKALSWKQVRELADRFKSLNPYDRTAIPGSILKIEDDNFDPATNKQRQLYCLAISAKRYALFLKDETGNPVLLRKGVNNEEEDRWSEHGLGHLLNPTDLASNDKEWIAAAWLNIVRSTLSLPTQDLSFAALPAVGRITITSPAVMRRLENFNDEKSYAEQIKPFNFLLTVHVNPLGHPTGVDPETFQLIAPYEKDSRRWLNLDWIDQDNGNLYRATTIGDYGTRRTARVKTYGEVLMEYEFHPEAKCADADGNVCSKQTVGLLQRRHVQVDQIKYIGKESNNLEDVEAGLIHSAQNAYTDYPDARRDEWQTKFLPALKKAKRKDLLDILSRSELTELRAGRSRPHPHNHEQIVTRLRELGLLDPVNKSNVLRRKL
jgi:hypothetical protein